MSTYDKILRQTDTLIQQSGFLGFSYADLAEVIGIRKASIHHHFPGKNDLGLAYCEYKIEVFGQLERDLHEVAPGVQRLKAYLNAFSNCAERGEMCGVYSMLSDSHQFSPELQKAVSRLAHTELLILEKVIASGQEIGELRSHVPPDMLAVMVCSALKGALLLNRVPPHEAYSEAVAVLIKMLDIRDSNNV
ncbi:TPA: TetR/AcrR family transcriptional regulator [Escherichia coli]|nr:TetR/AcrR family transcriptional regulator [Escherichia coli]HAW7808502.1 TetR/AcrR family transcriptional regulator [Escherichia coli]